MTTVHPSNSQSKYVLFRPSPCLTLGGSGNEYPRPLRVSRVLVGIQGPCEYPKSLRLFRVLATIQGPCEYPGSMRVCKVLVSTQGLGDYPRPLRVSRVLKGTQGPCEYPGSLRASPSPRASMLLRIFTILHVDTQLFCT
ncbi:uncharacterized protein LOC125030673 [Penaeus chinensis]|uniref:uncharacterized protein LOC125030673 n=1 Tax=Penaeus chinensis TaxID=139456 RepID=UPI001FB81F78|nr:uncharacterized protein LOC125030673 [Penaeus chinensis]